MKLERIRYEACPLCGNAAFAAISVDDCSRHPLYVAPLDPRITWMTCGQCSHVFTVGYWSADAQALILKKTLPHQAVGHCLEEQRPVAGRLIDRVLAACGPNGSAAPLTWLDVGFGDASLLLTAKEYGMHAVGVDIRDDNVVAARELGLEAYAADISEFKSLSAGLYDIVSLADVLEHVPFPEKVLGLVQSLIVTGGLLYIATPNRDSPLWKLLDRANANPYWNEIEHYHCFSREGLYTLLRATGFEPVRYGISERYRCGMEVLARAV